jgi:hypothetical protein
LQDGIKYHNAYLQDDEPYVEVHGVAWDYGFGGKMIF